DEIRISWNTKQLHDLALARARASQGRDHTPDELWGEVLPAEVDGEPTADYLFTRSLPRPRDVIQFLNQCRDTALAAGRHRITEDDVREATLVFSRWKTRDLPKEYGTRFPFLTELLVVFRDASHLLTRDGIAELLLVHQDSLMQRHSRYEDLLNADVVIELLFSVGFLGVRRRGRHVYGGAEERAVQPYESDFCVHPCFRPALNTTEPPALAALEMPPDHGVVVQTGYIQGGINTSNSFGGADVDISPRDDERG
uniref:P-loop ATPase, Sll1717 family n=1 Tax=Actinosynnema sp. TaxID=1872144 RepID=UPI003F841FC9